MIEPKQAEETKKERRLEKEAVIDAPIDEVWKALWKLSAKNGSNAYKKVFWTERIASAPISRWSRLSP